MDILAETNWRYYIKMLNEKLAKRGKKPINNEEIDFCLRWIDKTSKLEFIPSKVRVLLFHLPITIFALKNRIS